MLPLAGRLWRALLAQTTTAVATAMMICCCGCAVAAAGGEPSVFPVYHVRPPAGHVNE
jgi:hypothetical protein